MASSWVICSSAVVYATRALVYLARSEGRYAPSTRIAQQCRIPLRFLCKVLGRLQKSGILRSRKGSGGGFTLVISPAKIRLLDILHAVDGTAFDSRCAMGYGTCSVSHACAMHNKWIEERSYIEDYLQRTTVRGLATALDGTSETTI